MIVRSVCVCASQILFDIDAHIGEECLRPGGVNQLKPYGQSVTVTCGEADGRQAGKIGGDRKDVL